MSWEDFAIHLDMIRLTIELTDGPNILRTNKLPIKS